MIGLSVKQYVNTVFVPIFRSTIVAIIAPTLVLLTMDSCWQRLILSIIVSLLSAVGSVVYLGMTASERNKIFSAVKNYFKK